EFVGLWLYPNRWDKSPEEGRGEPESISKWQNQGARESCGLSLSQKQVWETRRVAGGLRERVTVARLVIRNCRGEGKEEDQQLQARNEGSGLKGDKDVPFSAAQVLYTKELLDGSNLTTSCFKLLT
ncbi:hypothetical protein KI387_021483, partial [Taxus chinensis]